MGGMGGGMGGGGWVAEWGRRAAWVAEWAAVAAAEWVTSETCSETSSACRHAQSHGFNLFSVKDDLKEDKDVAAKDEAEAAPQSPLAPAALRPLRTHGPQRSTSTSETGAKPEAVWEQYFSKNEPQPEAVRDAVRQLMNQRKFDHVIALIGAALAAPARGSRGCTKPCLGAGCRGTSEGRDRAGGHVGRRFRREPADLMYIGAYLPNWAERAGFASLSPGRRFGSRSARAVHARLAGGPGDRTISKD